MYFSKLNSVSNHSYLLLLKLTQVIQGIHHFTLEALQDKRRDHEHFLFRKSSTYACSKAHPKWPPRIRWKSLETTIQHPLWSKDIVIVAPYFRIMVEAIEIEDDGCFRRNRVFATYDSVCLRMPRDGCYRTFDSQSFSYAGFDVLKLRQMFKFQRPISDNFIHLSLSLEKFFGVSCQMVHQKGKCATGGFMARNLEM